jgi:hypothetical protein
LIILKKQIRLDQLKTITNYGWVIWKLLFIRLCDWSGNPFLFIFKIKKIVTESRNN